MVITPLLPEEQRRREFKQMRMVLLVSLRGSVSYFESVLSNFEQTSCRFTLTTSCAIHNSPGSPTRGSTLSQGPMAVARVACFRYFIVAWKMCSTLFEFLGDHTGSSW